MDSVPFFDGVSENPSVFAENINTLLTWSITPLQFGDHRPYTAATLLRLWRHRRGERAMRRDFTSPDDFLQDQLFDWLDENELAGEETNLSSVVGLFGKLVRDSLFDYAKYVQRLVARGEPGLSYTQVRKPIVNCILLLFTICCGCRKLNLAIVNFYDAFHYIIRRLHLLVNEK
jgi:mediator of RNA polymerase II transcription subunit 12